MCGIVGCNGNDALMRCMSTTLSQLSRGTQGSGYAWIAPSDNMWYSKSAMHPLKMAIANKYYTTNPSKIAVGHNRMPSHGSVKDDNCHPFFSCDNSFCLVHNGSLTFNAEHEKSIKATHKVIGETDSEILTHTICDMMRKNKETLEQTLEKIAVDEFLLATVIILAKTGDMYALKDNMPLHMCQIKSTTVGNYVMMASERDAIDNAIFDIRMKNPKLDVVYTVLEQGDLVHITKDGVVSISKHNIVRKISKHNAYSLYFDMGDYNFDTDSYFNNGAWIKNKNGTWTQSNTNKNKHKNQRSLEVNFCKVKECMNYRLKGKDVCSLHQHLDKANITTVNALDTKANMLTDMCIATGCTFNKVNGTSFCRTHGAQPKPRDTGDTKALEYKDFCNATNCTNKATNGGYCNKHQAIEGIDSKYPDEIVNTVHSAEDA
jgi:predicted glutamine amidotransferase